MTRARHRGSSQPLVMQSVSEAKCVPENAMKINYGAAVHSRFAGQEL